MSKAKRQNFTDWCNSLSPEQRQENAEATLKKVSDNAYFLLMIRENNKIVLQTDKVSKQVPNSHASHSYNCLARGMLEIELIRLCSLWDPAEQDAYTIPTIIGFLDDSTVIDFTARKIADHYKIFETATCLIGDTTGEELEAVKQSISEHGRARWQEEYDAISECSRKAIALSRSISGSAILKSVRNFRNKHLAHTTAMTRLERSVGTVAAPRHGDETILLDQSLKVLELLDLCVRGSSYSWSNTQKIAQRNAESFWHGVTVRVLR